MLDVGVPEYCKRKEPCAFFFFVITMGHTKGEQHLRKLLIGKRHP